MALAENYYTEVSRISTNPNQNITLVPKKAANKPGPMAALIAEIQAIIALMVALNKSQANTDNDKAKMEQTFAAKADNNYQKVVEAIKEYEAAKAEAAKWGLASKIICGVLGALMALAALCTGNIGLAVVIVAMTVAQETGGTEKLTGMLSKALGGGIGGQIGADLIMFAAMTVAGGGLAGGIDAGVNALAEGGAEAAEAAAEEAVQSALENAADDATQNATGDAENSATKISSTTSQFIQIGTMSFFDSNVLSDAVLAVAKVCHLNDWETGLLLVLISIIAMYGAGKLNAYALKNALPSMLNRLAQASKYINQMQYYENFSIGVGTLGEGIANAGTGWTQYLATQAEADGLKTQGTFDFYIMLEKMMSDYQNDENSNTTMKGFENVMNNIGAFAKPAEEVAHVLLQA